MSSDTRVMVTARGPGTIVAAVVGDLDSEAGEVMRELVTAALDQGATRVEIDLREVRGYTSDGVNGLAALHGPSACAHPPIVFVAESRAGRAALLAVQRVAARQ